MVWAVGSVCGRLLCLNHAYNILPILAARQIVLENGKNVAEALGDVAKGLETVEWACSMPQLITVGHYFSSSSLPTHN